MLLLLSPSPANSSPLAASPVRFPRRLNFICPKSLLSSSSLPPELDGDSDGAGLAATALSLLKQRRTDEAYALLSSSPHLPPDPVLLSRLLSQLSYSSSLPRALSLLRRLRHADLLHLLDCNSLGLLSSAAARLGQPRLSFSVLLSMLSSGLLPHLKAYSPAVSRLSSHSDSAPDALRLFDAILSHLRRHPRPPPDSLPDTAAFNAALNAAANLGDAVKFADLFHAMSDDWRLRPDVLTYNVMIKMCARVGRKDLVGRVLTGIVAAGITPCITTFCSLVAAYVGFGDLGAAERLVQALRESRLDIPALLSDLAVSESPVASGPGVSALEAILIAGGGSDEVLLQKAYAPDARMYTTLMKGYMKAGRVDDVVRTVRAMQREPDASSRPDHVTYTTVITALVHAGAVDRARAVLDEMTQAKVPANLVTYNVLLKGYCQQLQMDRARALKRVMESEAGISPDVVTYNILMDGCIVVDDSAGALAFFNEMRERGIAPSRVSYTTLMKAFARTGQPRLAHKVFDEMLRDPRAKPDRAAWNMLIEGYCHLGLIEDAKKLVERMKEGGTQPDVSTYGSLANGIAMARRPGEALLLWNEVKERWRGGEAGVVDGGLLGTLADVCVRAAFFQKALEIVVCMEENGIEPNKTRMRKIYIEMHSRMFTSKHASQARRDRRKERKRATEAFKFWLGLPNEYYGSEWRLEPVLEEDSPVPE